MVKLLAGVLLALSLAGCSDAADTQTQRSRDSSALESIDSSAIINNSTRLPTDSTSTTVTH
jgi:uncharacterized lipoprotein